MSIRFTFVLTALTLVAAACGSGTTTDVDLAENADVSDLDDTASTRRTAAAAAEVNQPNLATSSAAIDTEVLVVADGSITTLAEAAIGDRPLLIWFWAPL